MAEWVYVHYLRCPFCLKVVLEKIDLNKSVACPCGNFIWEGKAFTWCRKRRAENVRG